MEHARTSGSFERTEGMPGPDRWEERYNKLENNPSAQNEGYRAFSQGAAQFQNPADAGNGMGQDAQKRLKDRNNLAAGCFNGDPVVCRAQASLVQAGYNLGHYGNKGVDGINGPLTGQAIAEFQRANHLEPTGKPDQETMRMLDLATEKGLKKKDIEILGNKAARETDPLRQEPQQVKLVDELSSEAQHRLAGRDNLAGQARNGNPFIAKSQASLQMAGYDLGKCGIDGMNGPDTSKAVLAYQKDRGMNPTGKLDIETMISLNNSTAEGWRRPGPEPKIEKPNVSPVSHPKQNPGLDRNLNKNNQQHYIVSYDVTAAITRADSTHIPKNSVLYNQTKESQRQLQQMGFDIGPEGTDGKIGKHTKQAIRDFQATVHLPVTGVLDKVTAARMEGEFKKGMVVQKSITKREVEVITHDNWEKDLDCNNKIQLQSKKYPNIENPGGGRLADHSEAKPENLITIQGLDKKYMLDYRAAAAYNDMLKQARKDGINEPLIKIVSGYRSDVFQKQLYDAKYDTVKAAHQKWTKEQIAKETRRWVAPPGGSPHRTGRAIDLNMGISNDSQHAERQKDLEVYKWLEKNAVNYGFYNYKNEPWHWEYNPPAQKQ